MTAILGISGLYHDSAAALVVDGEIVAAAQEERFTRSKHDWRFPTCAIDYCLAEAGIDKRDVDLVAFYDKPLLKFDRLLETYLAAAPGGFPLFAWTLPSWLRERLHVRSAIQKTIGPSVAKQPIFLTHHEAHAASAFFPSPFDEAAILTLDGVGEWATATWGVGQGNRIRIENELRFPHSVGLLYSAFTAYCGFRVNSGEYKLMGLAPYGEPVYADRILEHLIDLKLDGSFRMHPSFFRYCRGLTMTSEKFHRLFGGPPRKPEGPLTERDMNLAASIQLVVEEIVLRMGRAIHEQTGQSRLCLAGGVALNCVANGRLLREGPFEEIWMQPAAGDAGGALGAALFTWHQLLENQRRPAPSDSQKGSLLGPAFSDDEVRTTLDDLGARYEHLESDGRLCTRVAELLADGKTVGWMQGRMEYGPRALGARSILADPRGADTQQTINLKIKFRESFRPFAPAVLVEDASQYFNLAPASESPFMLLVTDVAESARREDDSSKQVIGLDKLHVQRSSIPAVTHVDYSARVQTVDDERDARFHRLLREFKALTGVPVLVNTSFNVRGEPIICTPLDAYRCFMKTDLDVLAVGSFLLLKGDQPSWSRDEAGGDDALHDALGEPAMGVVSVVGEPRRGSLALFGAVVSLIVAALAWRWILPADDGVVAAAGIAIVGALLSSFGARWLRLPYTIWMLLTYPLRLAGSYVALGLFYFLVITPIGLLFRLLGRDTLAGRFDPTAASYWIKAQQDRPPASYFRQF